MNNACVEFGSLEITVTYQTHVYQYRSSSIAGCLWSSVCFDRVYDKVSKAHFKLHQFTSQHGGKYWNTVSVGHSASEKQDLTTRLPMSLSASRLGDFVNLSAEIYCT